MTALPRNLFCITLTNLLDDANIIEQLLTDFPEETEQCIPIALRQILESDKLPPVPFFSAEKLREYLAILWRHPIITTNINTFYAPKWLYKTIPQGSTAMNDLLLDSVNAQLIYFIPYAISHGASRQAIFDALDLGIRFDVDCAILHLFVEYYIHASERDELLTTAISKNNSIAVALLLHYGVSSAARKRAITEARLKKSNSMINKLLLRLETPSVYLWYMCNIKL
jgi:hypothetical protein